MVASHTRNIYAQYYHDNLCVQVICPASQIPVGDKQVASKQTVKDNLVKTSLGARPFDKFGLSCPGDKRTT